MNDQIQPAWNVLRGNQGQGPDQGNLPSAL
jgi:hypothetical protein